MTTPPTPEIDIHPGDVLAGKYRVERVLAFGGMGVVVAAHHLLLDERVALKFILPDHVESDEAIARFLREARAAVKIKSEHVARIIDVGRLENGSPFMVIEYLEGSDLAAWSKERGPMPVEQAVDFVLQACEAVAEAHALGIVHRDLKPANLFCVQRPDRPLLVKVLDFGISKMTIPGSEGHDMTTTGTIVGSPRYMSPEQLKSSRDVDARTDIWSLGIILYELLATRVPFSAPSVTELAIQIATAPYATIRSLRPDVPDRFEQVIARCLEKDRKRRFASVGDLIAALQEFRSPGQGASTERILGGPPAAEPLAPLALLPSAFPPVMSRTLAAPETPQTLATWGRTGAGIHGRPKRARPLVWVAACVVSACLSTVLLVTRSPPKMGVASTPKALAGGSTTASAPTAASALTPGLAAHPSASAAGPDVVSAMTDAAMAPTAEAVPRAPSPGVAPAGWVGRTLAPSATAPAWKRRADCDPPYTLDSEGQKHFKRECYLSK